MLSRPLSRRLQTIRTLIVFYVDLESETWIGASPELLLDYDKGEARTMALAGTKDLQEDFSPKEVEEQQMVQDFIEEKLQLLNLKYEKSEPGELIQSNIKHIKNQLFN